MLKFRTAKVVRFEARWIGLVSFMVKLSLAIGCLSLMFQKDSYQIFDRSSISSITVKVKQASNCSNNSTFLRNILNYTCDKTLYDENDYILPPIENSAVSIITRILEMEHTLKLCDDTQFDKNSTNLSLHVSSKHECFHRARCILPPFYREQYENEDLFHKNEQQQQLCWFKSPTVHERFNYQAVDYLLFIKHCIEFPHLNLIRHNLLPDIVTKKYLDTCEFDPSEHPLCPKFRVLKILQIVEKDPREYELMFYYGSVIEINISWKCNLDRSLKFCRPTYEFKRLDVMRNKVNAHDSASNFLTSRYYFQPNSTKLYRIHTRIYNLHIIISTNGEVGRFDLFQTTTSIGSFLGIFGTGSIVCDLIATFFTNFKRVKYDN